MSSQQEVFGVKKMSQKDIFASTAPPASAGRIFRHMSRKPGPRKLNIRKRPCPGCGETTTSLTNYSCPRKQFGGWWGQWKDMEPCSGKRA